MRRFEFLQLFSGWALNKDGRGALGRAPRPGIAALRDVVILTSRKGKSIRFAVFFRLNSDEPANSSVLQFVVHMAFKFLSVEHAAAHRAMNRGHVDTSLPAGDYLHAWAVATHVEFCNHN